jgi:hypothetical protein
MPTLPISALATLAYNNGAGINVQLPMTSGLISVALSGSNFLEDAMSVPTTAGGTAIPVSLLSSLGLTCIVNLDPVNYIDILSAVSGTAFARLLPGDPPFLFRWNPGITAPALLAHTAICVAQFLIIEN